MKIAIVIGTRPEIIKLSPVIKELEHRGIDFFVLHTGQHYSANLDSIFFDQLQLPQPKYNLEVGSHSPCKQTARIIEGMGGVLIGDKPDVVLVLGDTNSVLAGAIAGSKLHIKVGHIEAGLRSYDRSMPEEINRTLTDHCSDLLFAPTQNAREILLYEGIPDDQIFMTGNTIVDAIYANLELAKNVEVETYIEADKPYQYILATIHRTENVDNMIRFASILSSLQLVAQKYELPIVYPIHPHSLSKVKEFGFNLKALDVIEPMDYLQFLNLERNAGLILTDSGGVQEEACILGVPCVTLRDNTERPETIEVGANILAGTSHKRVMECVEIMLNSKSSWQNPFGDGRASIRIVDIIMERQ